MTAQANALSAISNNIANSSTVGYKAAGAQFESMLSQQATPVLSSGGVQTDMRYGVATQGTLTATSSASDLAIKGNGFFVVSNNGQGTFLTRAGNFVPDASGNLVNSAGYQLMGYAANSTALTPVNVAGATSVKINSDGTVTQVGADGKATTPFSIPLATVPSTNNLATADGNVFDLSNNSGTMTLAAPGVGGTGALSSGFLEQSTVDLGNELTNMIVTQRSYEANSKVLQTSSDLLGTLKSLSTG